MSAMSSLKGVGCEECKRKGHFCQAQIWEDCESEEDGVQVKFRKPLCMRCADGEICVYETVRLREVPEQLAEETDSCVVPALTEEDNSALKKMPKLKSIHSEGMFIEPETRAAMMEDLKTMMAHDVADKYGMTSEYVRRLRSKQESAVADRLRKQLRQHADREIDGEAVRIASLASTGTELGGVLKVR